MNKQEFDIIISGAGPAGSNCAMHLASSGLKITIIDKAAFPRHKICGGGLSDRAVNALKRAPDKLWDDFQKFGNKLPVSKIKLTSPDAVSISLNCPANYGYTVMRSEFDSFLLKKALTHKNITFLEGEKSLSYSYNNNNIAVKTNKTILSAKILVVADGINSLLARQSNCIKFNLKKSVVCVQTLCSPAKGNYQTETELYYPERCLPYYFWFFPLANGNINIGCGISSQVLRQEKKTAAAIFYDLLHHDNYIRQKIKPDNILLKPATALLPVQLLQKYFSTERLLIAGTAALLVDPLTGEGIGNAMLSGELAAQQILQAFKINDFSATHLKNYDKKIKAKLKMEFLRNSLILACFRKKSRINKGIKKAAVHSHFREDAEQMLIHNRMRWNLLNPLWYI